MYLQAILQSSDQEVELLGERECEFLKKLLPTPDCPSKRPFGFVSSTAVCESVPLHTIPQENLLAIFLHPVSISCVKNKVLLLF